MLALHDLQRGFKDGLLAYDPDVARSDSGKVVALWQPYRVLDPLIFLTTGNFCSLQLVE